MQNNPNKYSVYLLAMFIILMIIIACIASIANCQQYISRLTVFMIYYAVISSIFLTVYYRNNNIDILSPIIGFVVLLFLYSVASAIDVETNGATYYGDYISDNSLIQYYVICLTGLVGLMLGITTVKSNNMNNSVLKLPSNKSARSCIFILSIILASVFAVNIVNYFDFTNVKSYADVALISRVEKMQVSSAGLMEVFTQNVPIAFILSSAILLMFKKQLLFRLVGFVIIADYLLVNTLSGWRGLVMSATITLFSYYHYRIKAVKLKYGIIMGLLVYLFMNTMSVVRSSSNPLEMLTLLWDYFQKYGTKFLQLSSSGELIVGENLLRLIEGIHGDETQYTYGWSIITELMVFLPRTFFNERPLPLNERFVEVFYPGVRESGGGYGFFFLQEGYWAFGIVGVFLFMFFYGWITQKIYLIFRKHSANDLFVLSYGGVYYALVVSSVRNGVLGSIKATLMNCIPFVLVFVLLNLISRVNSVPSRKN